MPFLVPLLIRYVLPALAILGVLSWACYSVWDRGRQDERAVWVAEKNKWEKDMADLTEASRKRVDKQRKEFSELLARERNAKDRNAKTIDDLTTDLVNRGLYVGSQNCTGSAGGAKVGDTSKPSSGANRIRLDREDEQNLTAYAADAQRLTLQYNTLRELVKASKCFNIID